jgi:SAM-dependent methyltransferase
VSVQPQLYAREGADGDDLDEVFNSTVAAFALSASWELGLLTRMQTGPFAVDLDSFARDSDLHAPTVRAIAHALAVIDVLEISHGGNTATPGRLFGEAIAKKGFFYWLTRGCGELFTSLPDLAANRNRVGAFVRRDYRAVGIAARDAGHSFVDASFYDLVADRGLGSGADLGCGSAERLIRLAARDPDFRGIGIDIADGAVALAREAAAEAGVTDRLTILRGDAACLRPRPEFADIEFVSCFMMGHDLWPRAACVRSLQAIGAAFPGATDLILCDTYRSDLPATSRHPVFTLGFETAHAVMGQELPSLTDWVEVFEETGWTLATLLDYELPPHTALMHLTRPLPRAADPSGR